MERVLVIEAYRLTVDGYSVPKGSVGFFDEGSVRWLPPQLGISSPLVEEHFERCGELAIPTRFFTEAIT